jgi:uncharacterized protein YdeI (YjbR/CyaY-like superfamily)
MPPKPRDVRFFETPAELRAWLEANHDSASEVWVGFHRKRSGKPSLTWPQVVDEALCFGWIDSVRYGLDETSYANRLTPRTKKSIWSTVNIRRFEELSRLGRVHPRGTAAFEARDEARSHVYSYESRYAEGLDAAREAALRSAPAAWEFFQAQPPGYRRLAAHWVMSARREETRQRRVGALIEHSRKRERLPWSSSTGRSE